MLKMLFAYLTSSLLGLFLFSTAVDAKTDEFFEMKVFNHDFEASDSEMHAILEKANLPAHGYKKEVVTKLVQNAGGQDYQKAYFYYKSINCSKMQEVEQELERLLPGKS
ncbi:uncharacterized protein LOC110064318 [Orbicella faveolata]|uniref:uncharacterized protein LOC110064318 n=1 Tax=Orbicella faveolata TaxID=48498 RepID=UPI0009E2B46D|nr:uncharacterized protein LOC110064318 [Orbicella faveolata]